LSGEWEESHAVLRERLRVQAGQAQTPSAAIIARQSVKTTEQRDPGHDGFDGAKQVM
jgi:hypothetical protein